VRPRYGRGHALSRHNSRRSAASAQHEFAVSDGLFHDGMLRPELFEQHSSESAQLLQSASGAGQSDQPGAGRTAFRFDRQYARSRGDARDFALAK
jgi:hypothetical protein